MIQLSFLIEASFIALTAIFVGTLFGLIVSHSVIADVASQPSYEMVTLHVPWVNLAIVFTVVTSSRWQRHWPRRAGVEDLPGRSAEVRVTAVAETSRAPRRTLPRALDRRFEAVVFDWDGTAVPDRQADATRLRELVEALTAHGMDLAVVTGTHVQNVDDQLAARPQGPGRLYLCMNRGSEVFVADADGRGLSLAETRRRPRIVHSMSPPRSPLRGLPSAASTRDRFAAFEPPEDRPDPRARVGGSAQGSDRRVARRRCRPVSTLPASAGSTRRSSSRGGRR